MNSKRFLTLFLLFLCLFAFVKAGEDGYDDDEIPEAEEVIDEEEEVEAPAKEEKTEEPKATTSVAPEPPKATTVAPEPPKTTTTVAPPPPKVTTTVAPAPPKASSVVTPPKKESPVVQAPPKTQAPIKNESSVPSNNTPAEKKPSNSSSSPASSSASSSAASSTSSSSSDEKKNSPAPANNAAAAAPANNAAAPVNNAATPANKAAAPAGNGIVNPIVPANNAGQSAKTVSKSNNTSNANSESKEEGGSGAVKTTVISLVAVGAVVGVATVGVRVYNKKTNENRGIDLGDIEAQPINNDFGKSNNDLSGMPPEEYNPYNIMNDAPNEPFVTNNPYEYKPNYEDVIETTPFNKVENTQDNFMSRESIFSNPANNIPQIGNDVFNFNDNSQLPYVQEHTIENSYIEEPVANQMSVENNDMPNSQMPTLVPVQPEIVITEAEEEPAQEGYKQIVPTVAQMEIIETPDFNNMTTSMIEDHINNMDLENLANTETQQQEDVDTGYKQIVPDIQEAVIENFDIDDDEEDPDMSVVDNITDTYRAALRATYCSATTDENRFSYRTVDSDHSLLHTMREDGQW